jgi:hypothetical protein
LTGVRFVAPFGVFLGTRTSRPKFRDLGG